ncbi:Digeranylgeranylglyceryl phosphate synthase [Cytospora mali]|uniref:Digeranylgeranylglyceryl phosphate synthase n=1 Tax=Cytospora mali TaxID=578113 RepID=A0A194W113_CYTMA|nr:Digeranylgeranylglyceryl phosphate synthase [Valsa mali]
MIRSVWSRPATKPGPKSPASLQQQFSNSTSSLLYHAYTVYLFSCNNIKDIICMGFLFGVLTASVASRVSMGPSLPFSQIFKSAPGMLLWSWSNLFLFNLHNQRHAPAIAEDAINKPWRPLPAGRLSPHQATRIMYCTYPVVLLISSAAGGMLPCLLEAVFCLWYNEWGGASDPVLKNILNGLGFACFFAGPLEIATGNSVFSGGMKAATWLSILAAAISTTSHAQDFRDMDGDRATGRMTVPLLIGDMNARVLLAVGVTGWTGVACWFWGVGLAEWKDSAVAWAAGAVMVGNFLRDRTRQGDALSWKLFPLWLLGLMMLPVQVGKMLS